MTLEIVEQSRKTLKTFETTEEFMKYYEKHQERLDALTTHALNKYYVIAGHRLTRLQGKLKLKVVPPTSTSQVCAEHIVEPILKSDLEQRVVELERLVNELVLRFNSMLEG